MAASGLVTPASTAEAPRVSVVIATGARGALLRGALRSVLENRMDGFDVWIADMRTGHSTRDDLGPLVDDPRVTLVPTEARGSTAAHNRVISMARGEILAITDDDCEVADDWVEAMVRAFDRDPRIGVVFGNVHPAAPDDPSAPAYVREDEFVARGLGDKLHVEGIWACMGVRRRTWEELGGFDERFGRGARFPGAADADFTVRALAAGHFVCRTPGVSVRTHRSLSPDEHRETVAGYTYASGALMGKHLRQRTPGILRLAAGLGRRWLGGRAHSALGAPGSKRLPRLGAFLRGLVRGAVVSAD